MYAIVRSLLASIVFLITALFFAAVPASAGAELELIETFPVETSLDNADLREAHEVWIEMIAGARRTLDVEQFYVSNVEGSRLEAVIEAIEAAATRGVRVRVIAGKRFEETYPETVARLDALSNVEARFFDVGSIMGGVQHSKFFIVDGESIFVGSQNFDWRALEHIQELGVSVSESPVVRAFQDVFETDWALAGGADPDFRAARSTPAGVFPAPITVGSDTVLVTPALSPREFLPDPSLWDLPMLVELIEGAESKVQVQLLTYKAVGRDRRFFPELETALRDAAARGVTVQLLVAHWCQRKWTIEGLKSLQELPGIEVKLMTIPAWSGGFIPFGRVNHSKYMVVDGARAWIGTSNWEKGYFHQSRNMGLIIDGAAVAGRLAAYFDKGWSSAYSETVDSCRDYPAPRVAE